MELGIDEPGGAAVDVFETFPDDAWFVEEDVVCHECVEGWALGYWLGLGCVRGVDVGIGSRIGAGTGISIRIRLGLCGGIGVRVRSDRFIAKGLVHDGQVCIAKERNERPRLQR